MTVFPLSCIINLNLLSAPNLLLVFEQYFVALYFYSQQYRFGIFSQNLDTFSNLYCQPYTSATKKEKNCNKNTFRSMKATEKNPTLVCTEL